MERSRRPGFSSRGMGLLLAAIVLSAVLPVTLVYTFQAPVPFVMTVALGFLFQIGIFLFMIVHWRVTPSDPWIWIALVYGLSQLATLASTALGQGSYEVIDLVNAGAKSIGVLLFAGVVQSLPVNYAEIQRFLKSFLWLVGIAVAANMVLNFGDFSGILTASSSYELNFSGIFANRNQFGYFLFLGIVASFLYFHGTKVHVIHVVFLSAQILSLLLTMSRGAILAFGVFIFGLVLLWLKKRPFYFISLIVWLLMLVAIGAYFNFGDVVDRLFVRSKEGVTGRDDLWIAGLQVWLDHNIFLGVGTYRGLVIAQSDGMHFGEFHNFAVETLVSGGLLEFGILVLIFLTVWRSLIRSRVDHSVKFVFAAAFLGMLVLSLVESISFFTIGLAGTLFTIFFISLPIMYSSVGKIDELEPIF